MFRRSDDDPQLPPNPPPGDPEYPIGTGPEPSPGSFFCHITGMTTPLSHPIHGGENPTSVGTNTLRVQVRGGLNPGTDLSPGLYRWGHIIMIPTIIQNETASDKDTVKVRNSFSSPRASNPNYQYWNSSLGRYVTYYYHRYKRILDEASFEQAWNTGESNNPLRYRTNEYNALDYVMRKPYVAPPESWGPRTESATDYYNMPGDFWQPSRITSWWPDKERTHYRYSGLTHNTTNPYEHDREWGPSYYWQFLSNDADFLIDVKNMEDQPAVLRMRFYFVYCPEPPRVDYGFFNNVDITEEVNFICYRDINLNSSVAKGHVEVDHNIDSAEGSATIHYKGVGDNTWRYLPEGIFEFDEERGYDFKFSGYLNTDNYSSGSLIIEKTTSTGSILSQSSGEFTSNSRILYSFNNKFTDDVDEPGKTRYNRINFRMIGLTPADDNGGGEEGDNPGFE